MTAARVWVPRPDQEAVMGWLAGRERGLVMAPTGSGKTVMAATWLHDRMLDRFDAEKALIVTPELVIENWLAQFVQWEHLAGLRELTRVIPFEDLGLQRQMRGGKPGGLVFADKRATKKRIMSAPGRVHLCSWQAFSWLEEALGASWPYDTLILDESTFVKDRGSARGRAARRAVHLSGRVDRVLLLTATPNSNGDEALFPQLDLVERGCLGSGLTDFRDTWCVPATKNWQTGQVFKWKVNPARLPEFDAIVGRLAVSVPDSLGIEVLEVEHFIDLSDAARQEYDRMAATQVLDDVTAASEAVLHAKLRQLATGYVYTDDGSARQVHDLKLRQLARLLEEIPGPVLLAYNWTFEADAVKDALKDSFKDIREPRAKADFLAGKVRVLGVHPQSAGHGVDGLQAVSHNVIWLSVPEDRELYDQLNGRLKRGGQGAPTVFAHVLVARDTKEHDVWRYTLPRKLANAQRTLAAARL